MKRKPAGQMSGDLHDAMLRFPPRELTPGERQVFSQWLGLAGDISGAYVSGRRSDDPALYRRIVVLAGPGDQPTHLIHSPEGMHIWVKVTIGPDLRIEMFDALHTALNSIHYVLA